MTDLDPQSLGGLVAIHLTPAADGQSPLVSLEIEGGPKHYARVWLNNPGSVEWGWVLPDVAVTVWSETDPVRPALDGLLAAWDGFDLGDYADDSEGVAGLVDLLEPWMESLRSAINETETG